MKKKPIKKKKNRSRKNKNKQKNLNIARHLNHSSDYPVSVSVDEKDDHDFNDMDSKSCAKSRLMSILGKDRATLR